MGTESVEPEQVPRSGRLTWILLGLLVVFTAGYITIIVGFVHSGGVWKKTYYTVGAQTPNRIDVTASLVSVDPERGLVQLQTQFAPQGSFRGQGGAVTSPIEVETNSIGSQYKQTSLPGARLFSGEANLDLSGDNAYYPLDKHIADFDMDITTGEAFNEPVPARLTLVSSLHDWHVKFTATNGLPEGDFDVALDIKRSAPVTMLAFGIMAVEVLLVLIEVGVVIRSVRLRKVRFSTLAALAALLFAIPAIRNSLPQAPPVGALSDFLVFFWALIVAGACFIVAALSWFKNASKTDEI